MKKTMCALAVCAIGTLALGNGTASAFTLGGGYQSGDAVQFVFTGLTSFGSTQYDAGPMGTGETWGIFKVTTIQSPTGGGGTGDPYWQQYQDNEQIYGIFYGLTDWQVLGGGVGNFDIYQQNGSFDLFISTTTNHTGEYKTTQGPAGRTAFNGYNTVTNIVGAQPFLSGKFVDGVVVGDTRTTILQSVTSASSPATGVGSGYADLTGGLYQSMFENPNKDQDLYFIFSVLDGAKSGWSQRVTGTIDTTPVPVPATLLLLGSSLAGLLGLRRKRNA